MSLKKANRMIVKLNLFCKNHMAIQYISLPTLQEQLVIQKLQLFLMQRLYQF